MSGSQILDAMEHIDPVYIEEAEEEPHRQKKTWLMRSALAACFALVVVSTALLQMSQNALLPIQQAPMIGIMSESTGGPRKYLNYDGCQYVFLENGSPFELTEAHLGEALGHLEYDILVDREANSARDYAATFAVGGTIYRMTNYDPAFRVAVEFEENYYICEKTGNTDGTDLDAADLFEAADFRKTVTEIILYDHFGQNELGRLSGGDAKELIKLLAQVSPASLTNEDYEEIGKAQKAGKSFLVVFQLADTTRYQLYVIPSMSIAMIGNGRYTLPDEFHSAFDATFAALKPADAAPQS